MLLKAEIILNNFVRVHWGTHDLNLVVRYCSVCGGA